MTGKEGFLNLICFKYSENFDEGSFINGEWNAPETFNFRNLLQEISLDKLSKASSEPDKTTWEELLSLAITTSSIFCTNRSSWFLSKPITAAIDPFPALTINWDLSFIRKTQSLNEKGFKPNYVAGHSLGEITALYCSDVFSFEDCVSLIKERSQLMVNALIETFLL